MRYLNSRPALSVQSGAPVRCSAWLGVWFMASALLMLWAVGATMWAALSDIALWEMKRQMGCNASIYEQQLLLLRQECQSLRQQLQSARYSNSSRSAPSSASRWQLDADATKPAQPDGQGHPMNVPPSVRAESPSHTLTCLCAPCVCSQVSKAYVKTPNVEYRSSEVIHGLEASPAESSRHRL